MSQAEVEPEEENPLMWRVVFGKKYVGWQWNEVVVKDPSYVRWVVREVEHHSITDDLREALEEAVDDQELPF